MEGGYNLRNPAVKRLMREAQELKDKTEQFSAYPLEDNLFEWHFTIRGPADSDFENGIYHGRIVLPPEYPMKPPSIILLTPSGRFETNRKICLSISGFHPESWQPSWSLRTALLGIIGFMPTHGNGAIGSLDYTSEERKVLARKSQEWKCPHCGLIKDLVLPITELSKELNKEAKELGQQINMQGEKQKASNEEATVPEEATGITNTTTTTASAIPEVPVSSAQQPDLLTSTPQTPMPNIPSSFNSFQRLQVQGMLPNFSFPLPPFMMPQFSFQFPGMPIQNPATAASTNQPLPNPLMNPYLPFMIPPPIFMPNLFPGQFPSSMPNAVSPPSVLGTPFFTGGPIQPPRPATNIQQLSSQMSTTTVTSQTSPIISTTPSSNFGVQPKESIKPSLPQSSTTSPTFVESSETATPAEKHDTQGQSKSTKEYEERSNNVTDPSDKSKDPSDKSKDTIEAKVTEDVEATESTPVASTPLSRVDDGDPVPLAGNLRHRSRPAVNDDQANPSQAGRTDQPVTNNRPRFTTRAGIMDAMADLFIIVLLFCIFGLLARRVSMFL